VQKGKYVLISGNCAVGKTTLAALIAKKLGFDFFGEEWQKNPFNKGNYDKKTQLEVDLWFLQKRAKQLKKIEKEIKRGKNVVGERCMQEGRIFCSSLLSKKELVLFDSFLGLLNYYCIKPDLLVFLEANPKELFGRIKKRKREFEKRLSLHHLQKLDKAYKKFFDSYRGKKIKIDSGLLDFCSNGEHIKKAVQQIKSALKE